jgi:hypothetical protein
VTLTARDKERLVSEILSTGLRRGDAATIARIHRVSRHHVIECAAGRRVPLNKKLLATIERYRELARAYQEVAA